jgi:hypothetical protein
MSSASRTKRSACPRSDDDSRAIGRHKDMTIVISTQPPTAATVEPEYREEVREMTIELDRRELLRTGAGAGAALGVAALGFPSLAEADEGGVGIGEVYRLQAAFHRAKTTQDIELMMSFGPKRRRSPTRVTRTHRMSARIACGRLGRLGLVHASPLLARAVIQDPDRSAR